MAPATQSIQEREYDKACLLAEQGRYALAIQQALALLSVAPEHANGHNILSFCYARQQKPKEAIDAANRAIALAPTNDFHYYRLADAHDKAHHYEAAAAAIKTALELNPNRIDSYGMASLISHHRRQLKEALIWAESGLRLNPEHLTCLNLRILALVELNRIEEAEPDIVRSRQLNPEQAFPHAAAGLLALHRREQTVALDSFKTALQIDPNSDWARRGLMEAMKAKNGFYRLLLSYELWQSKFQRQRPALFWSFWLIFPPVRALYGLLVLTTLFVRYLADVGLRAHPYGKLLFSPRETWLNNCALIALGLIALGGWRSAVVDDSAYLGLGLLLGAIAYGSCLCWFGESKSRQIMYGLLTGVVVLIAVLVIVSLMPGVSSGMVEQLRSVGAAVFALALIASLLVYLLLICYHGLQQIANRHR
ncbi:MAG: tetratricopeptide repeat protein [Cyanobacteria bacterium J06597_16]